MDEKCNMKASYIDKKRFVIDVEAWHYISLAVNTVSNVTKFR